MIFEQAVIFAAKAHMGQKRKGKDKPYLLHPLEAAAIVGTLTSDDEVLAAAVLHDTVEDTETTKDDLAEVFGQRVADLVADESEDKRDDIPADITWKLRKTETIEHLRHASREDKMICLGDKLSNIREIRADHDFFGGELWDRFNQKDPKMHAWYYGSILKILSAEFDEDCPAVCEYRMHFRHVFWDYLDIEDYIAMFATCADGPEAEL